VQKADRNAQLLSEVCNNFFQITNCKAQEMKNSLDAAMQASKVSSMRWLGHDRSDPRSGCHYHRRGIQHRWHERRSGVYGSATGHFYSTGGVLRAGGPATISYSDGPATRCSSAPTWPTSSVWLSQTLLYQRWPRTVQEIPSWHPCLDVNSNTALSLV